jgi:hypothetical protein
MRRNIIRMPTGLASGAIRRSRILPLFWELPAASRLSREREIAFSIRAVSKRCAKFQVPPISSDFITIGQLARASKR